MTEHEVPQFVLDRAKAAKPIFTADEVACWPEGLLDRLVTDDILKATDNAGAVTCDACGEDHVEEVQYIDSPPGSELRAYIWCAESGRVRVPLDRLRRWIVSKQSTSVAVWLRESDKLSSEQWGTGPHEPLSADVAATWPDDCFRDEDGTPLTAPILSARFGIPDSRLKEWREKGCPALGGRKLAAKKLPKVGWVYFRMHVNEIANRRDDQAKVGDELNIAARLEAAANMKRDQQIGGPLKNSR